MDVAAVIATAAIGVVIGLVIGGVAGSANKADAHLQACAIKGEISINTIPIKCTVIVTENK